MADRVSGDNTPPNSAVALTGQAGFAGIPGGAWPWLAGLLLAVAVGVVYGRSLHAPFIFDDHESVLTNESIRQLWPLWDGADASSPLHPARQSSTAGRPLVNLSLAVNYAIGGVDPLGYHVLNAALHFLSAWLLWGIVRRTLRLDYFEGAFEQAADPLAFLVALVWAVHPLTTEAVQYVTQRTELMVGLFYLATVYGGLRYFTAASPQGRKLWCLLAALSCLLGMACKEVMVTAPVVVLLFDWTFVSGSFRKAFKQSWPLYAALAAGWGLLLLLNYNGPRSESAGFGGDAPLVGWWLMQARVLVMYVKLAVWPWPLVIHYQVPLYENPLAAWIPLATLGLLAAFLRIWRRGAAGFVGLCVLIVLAPTLVVPILTEHAAERRMYLPLAAIVALVVVGGYWLLRDLMAKDETAGVGKGSGSPLAITAVVTLVVAGVLAVASARRLNLYNDELALWQDAAVHQPDDFFVLCSLGRILLLEGREPAANVYFERAAEIKPESTHRQWGFVLIEAGHPAEGIAHVEQAIRLKPEWAATLHRNLALALWKQNTHAAAAIAHLQQAQRLQPDSAEISQYLAQALAAGFRPQEAIAQAQRAATLAPNSTEARQQLESLVETAREQEETVKRLRVRLKAEGESARLHFELGEALARAGQLDEAEQALEAAVRLDPGHAPALVLLEQVRRAKTAKETKKPAHAPGAGKS